MGGSREGEAANEVAQTQEIQSMMEGGGEHKTNGGEGKEETHLTR